MVAFGRRGRLARCGLTALLTVAAWASFGHAIMAETPAAKRGQGAGENTASPAATGPILAPRAFTSAFVAQLRRVMPGRTVEIKAPLEVRYQLADGSWSTAFLDNAYRTYRERPAEREAIIRHYTDVYARLATNVDTPVQVRRIVPVVKDRRWLDGALTTIRSSAGGRSRTPSGKGSPPVYDRLNETLVVVYAEDTPSHLRYVTGDMLKKVRIGPGRLREVAVANLKRVLPRLKFRHRPDIGVIEADGVYEASLLVVPEVWIELKGKVDGDPVVAIPARGKLMFTGSRNAEGIKLLRRMAGEIARASSYPLTDRLFVVRAGKVETLR